MENNKADNSTQLSGEKDRPLHVTAWKCHLNVRRRTGKGRPRRDNMEGPSMLSALGPSQPLNMLCPLEPYACSQNSACLALEPRCRKLCEFRRGGHVLRGEKDPCSAGLCRALLSSALRWRRAGPGVGKSRSRHGHHDGGGP